MRLLLTSLFLTSCFSGDLLLGEADPASIPETPTYELHIKPIMEYYCVACHYPGTGGEERRSELVEERRSELVEERSLLPKDEALSLYSGDDGGGINGGEEPDLSTYEAIVDEFEGVAEEIFESQSMPPGASRRLSPREETILARWAAKGFPR